MRERIKQTAVSMIADQGLENLSRNTLCAKAGIPAGSFAHVMGQSFKAFIRELAAEGHHGPPGREVTKRRIDPALRRNHIVETALRLAEEGHYAKVTRAQVAHAAGVSEGTVSKCFNTMPQLRRAVLRMARANGNTTVLNQARNV